MNYLKNKEKHSKTIGGYFSPGKENYLKNLKFIYCAENYCLRRIPRLVILVQHDRLSQLLSDHVSILMDRLNRLDDICRFFNQRPSGLSCATFKSIINRLGSLVKVIHLKNRRENTDLINELIQVSLYRHSIYLNLMDMACTNGGHEIIILLSKSLMEEHQFYQNLFNLKNNITEMKIAAGKPAYSIENI